MAADSSRGGRSNGPMRGANVRTSVRITFEEAIFGCEKEIELNYKGRRVRPVMERVQSREPQPETCPKCNGKGKIMYTQQSFFGHGSECTDLSGL